MLLQPIKVYETCSQKKNLQQDEIPENEDFPWWKKIAWKQKTVSELLLFDDEYLNFSAKQWKQEEKLLNEANWNGKNWKYELNMETPWCGLWGEGTRKFIRISVAKGNVTWEEIKKCQRNGNNVSTIHSVPQLRWKFSDVHKSSLSVSISSVRQRKLVSYSKALSKHGEENSYKFKGKVRNRMGWWKPQ